MIQVVTDETNCRKTRRIRVVGGKGTSCVRFWKAGAVAVARTNARTHVGDGTCPSRTGPGQRHRGTEGGPCRDRVCARVCRQGTGGHRWASRRRQSGSRPCPWMDCLPLPHALASFFPGFFLSVETPFSPSSKGRKNLLLAAAAHKRRLDFGWTGFQQAVLSLCGRCSRNGHGCERNGHGCLV